MRRFITDVVELVGLGCLTIGAAGWQTWAGWIVGGASLIYAGSSYGVRRAAPDPIAERDAIIRQVIAEREGRAA